MYSWGFSGLGLPIFKVKTDATKMRVNITTVFTVIFIALDVIQEDSLNIPAIRAVRICMTVVLMHT
jgi:hypothetical protein